MSDGVTIRNAALEDIGGILAIFNEAIVNTMAIWIDEPVDMDERTKWFRDHQSAGFPIIVAVDEAGDVAGYGAYGDWRPYAGYLYTVEHSIYVDPAHQGRGIGAALLKELIGRARAQGLRDMIACIDSGNEGSIRLHEKFGFETKGEFPGVGRKAGQKRDLTIMQLTVDKMK